MKNHTRVDMALLRRTPALTTAVLAAANGKESTVIVRNGVETAAIVPLEILVESDRLKEEGGGDED